MPTYKYKALNPAGRVVKGEMTLDNDRELEEKLRKVHLDLLWCTDKKKSKPMLGIGRVKTRDLILFCVHMEQLERAGVPLLDSITDLYENADNPRIEKIAGTLVDDIKNGYLLSEAMALQPEVFTNVFQGLISVGERTGNLADAFLNLTNHLKWNDELKRKIKKATRYPLVLLVMLSGVISLMMLFVVPQLTNFLTSQGFALPFHTRALIATSEFMQNYWYLVFSIPVIIFFLVKFIARRNENFAYWLDKVALKIPFVGNVVRKIELSRFTNFFAVTFRSGIDVIECMDTGLDVVNNRVIKEAIYYARLGVSEGTTLTESLLITNQCPSLVLRMFKMGEESGKMEEALENVTFFYDREVNDAVELMVGAIQPTMTIVLGALLFWIIASIFGPLYSSFEKMNF